MLEAVVVIEGDKKRSYNLPLPPLDSMVVQKLASFPNSPLVRQKKQQKKNNKEKYFLRGEDGEPGNEASIRHGKIIPAKDDKQEGRKLFSAYPA